MLIMIERYDWMEWAFLLCTEQIPFLLSRSWLFCELMNCVKLIAKMLRRVYILQTFQKKLLVEFFPVSVIGVLICVLETACF